MDASWLAINGFSTACVLYGLGCGAFFAGKPRWCDGFLLVGLVAHTAAQLARGWFIPMFVPNAILEEIFFLPWVMASMAAIGLRSGRDRQAARSMLVPILAFSLVGVFAPKGIFPPSPKDQTVFATLFFLTEVVAHACFLLGGWIAVRGLWRRELAQSFHTYLIWGFVFYSAAQILGAVWCYLGWSAPLSWSPRHLQSASMWCFYAAFLHLRFLPKWGYARRARFAAVGSLLVIVFAYGGLLAEMGMKIGV
jgi:ABC-type transport system involved in cytochrome c biogenesis permease subunit